MIKRYHRSSGEFYRVMIRPTSLYGAKCWPIKNSYIQKIHVLEIGILRWMCAQTKSKKIKNEYIQDKVGVTSMMDKLRES